MTTADKIEKAVDLIQADFDIRYKQLREVGKNIEAERLKTKTEYDMRC